MLVCHPYTDGEIVLIGFVVKYLGGAYGVVLVDCKKGVIPCPLSLGKAEVQAYIAIRVSGMQLAQPGCLRVGFPKLWYRLIRANWVPHWPPN